MQEKFNLLAVQNALGYVFKSPELVQTAFIHKSYEKNGTENNARLVLVGQKLFDLIVCDYACTHSEAKGEKQLQSAIESYVKALGIEAFAKNKGLLRYLTMSSISEPMRDGAQVGRDIFFAITAAIYKDGGLPALKGFLLPMLRGCGSKEHYEPASEGRVLSRADADISTEKHIRNEKLRPGKKGSVISVSKAETISLAQKKAETVKVAAIQKEEPKKTEKPKKESSLSKLLKKKEKEAQSEPIEVTEPSAPQRRFIRDALAPVRLSDDLRNFKPKKAARTYDEQKSSAPAPAPAPAPISVDNTEEENYKSLLQEYVQKNVRTASVLIKYETKPVSKNEWVATVYLQDGKLATGKGANKKSAEKAAAATAFKSIKTKGSEQYNFFISLGDGDITPTSPSVDYVSKINQYFQKTKHLSSAPIDYEKRHSGAKNVFAVAVMYEGKEIAIGKGTNPKEAKQNAAMLAAKTLGIK